MNSVHQINEKGIIYDLDPGSFWAVKKGMVYKYGFMTAVWFAEILSKLRKLRSVGILNDEGWFYYKKENIYEATGISLNAQKDIIIKLKEDGLIDVVQKGLPKKNFYKINFAKYYSIVAETPYEDGEENNDKTYQNVKINRNYHSSDIRTPEVHVQELPDVTIYKELNNNNYQKNCFSKEKQIATAGERLHSSVDLKEEAEEAENIKENEMIPSQSQFIRQNKSQLYKKRKFTYSPPSYISSLITLWNSFNLRNHKEKDTKQIKELTSIVHDIVNGKFICVIKNNENNTTEQITMHYSLKDIQKSLLNLSLAANNPDYEPTNGFKNYLKKQLSINDFFYNKRKGTSLFLTYLEKPKLIKQSIRRINEKNPLLTDYIKSFYVDEACGGACELNEQQINKFRDAGNRCVNFIEKYGNKFSDWVSRDDYNMAKILCNVIKYIVDNQEEGDWSKVSPGWFNSDTTWNIRVPRYMNSNSMLTNNTFYG